MIKYIDAEAIIQIYIDLYDNIKNEYKAGESNTEIAHCNNILNMLYSILNALKLANKLDELDKCCDYPFITTDILKIMLNSKADRQLINALLKNRGDK